MNSTYLTASLLILTLLSNAAQGIRLENGIKQPVGQQKKTLTDESPVMIIEEGFKKFTPCGDGNHNSGKNRKLLTSTPSSPSTAISRTEEEKKANPITKEGQDQSVKEKDFSNSEPISKNLEAALEHYHDLVDIAEMDYSPAKRKPPIHN